MTNKNNKMISSLFHERKKFIVIGLTGRTGSGCTTAATILETEAPTFPKPEETKYKNNPFFSSLDSKRYEIASKYIRENHHPFISIKVSDLISAYILNLNTKQIIDFIKPQTPDISRSKIEETIKKGSFSNSYLKKGTLQDISKKILDHSNQENLTEKEMNKFFSFMKLIRKFTSDFKSELRAINNELYIKVYQAAGNSIRKLGKVQADYESQEFEPESVLHLPESINRSIKIIRKIREDRAFIVIDAIRNPYEARYFKDRYSAFYLVSINAPNEDRKSYLQNEHKYTVDEFDELEKRESGKTKISDADFISQNVKRCIEISDIHIFNPRNEIENNNVLKSQIAWYLALMQHPGLISPTSLERVMQIAYTAKVNSGCISRQVGAAITDKDYSIKAVGWNDVAKGQVPCNLRSLQGLENNFDEITYSAYERNNKKFRSAAKEQLLRIIDQPEVEGKNLSYCFKDIKNSIDDQGNQVHTRSLHAEENAFLQLAKYGSSGIEGGKLFTTASPCELCAKKAYQLGVKDIVYIDPYPGIAMDHIISIGENPPNLVQFRGAVGKGYHSLYEPTISYKDELNYLKS
ncbi:deoxycytidylate deaminase [Microbulbifer elongatus]|uniref:Deoxycytidylate deaminase n=1 Tax=Microbulbifer elongatus TaxID=86173 RepID=A0ABT1NY01_9GAMM|nr:anti-phage dCTP deaminase [Microbulbifer elongatus]MCQ3828759.1 deoxycytidylate deaminase [Microbulbifer elongatus]